MKRNDWDQVTLNWEQWGKIDPRWAVLTDPGKENGGWRGKDFLETGVGDVYRHLTLLGQLAEWGPTGHAYRPDEVAIDFGCGAGRLTSNLSKIYGHVIGVDVSEGMIAEAVRLKTNFPAYWATRPDHIVEFIHLTEPHLGKIPDQYAHLVFSLITLQHNATRLQLSFIREFMRVLRVGGYAVFGAMAEPLTRVWNEPGEQGYPRMHMYGVNPSDVVGTVRLHGGTVLDIRYDRGQSEWSPAWINFMYYVRKDRHVSTDVRE